MFKAIISIIIVIAIIIFSISIRCTLAFKEISINGLEAGKGYKWRDEKLPDYFNDDLYNALEDVRGDKIVIRYGYRSFCIFNVRIVGGENVWPITLSLVTKADGKFKIIEFNITKDCKSIDIQTGLTSR